MLLFLVQAAGGWQEPGPRWPFPHPLPATAPRSSGLQLNLPPRCEELLRKAVESHSQREKAFRQKCGGKKSEGEGWQQKRDWGLAASDVSEDGGFQQHSRSF